MKRCLWTCTKCKGSDQSVHGKSILLGPVVRRNDIVSYSINKILIIKYGIYTNIFAEKMWVAFAFAKAAHIFSAKITVNLINVLTRAVNILTTNKLVKLTMLWTTGSWPLLSVHTFCSIQWFCEQTEMALIRLHRYYSIWRNIVIPFSIHLFVCFLFVGQSINICVNSNFDPNVQVHFPRTITKTRLFKYMENFTSKKLEIFQIKNSDSFHISAQKKHRLWVLVRTASVRRF